MCLSSLTCLNEQTPETTRNHSDGPTHGASQEGAPPGRRPDPDPEDSRPLSMQTNVQMCLQLLLFPSSLTTQGHLWRSGGVGEWGLHP